MCGQCPQNGASLTLLANLAGCESRGWNTLIDRLVRTADRLEEQGYVYDRVRGQMIELPLCTMKTA